jgi:hypothetical protein
MQAHLNADARTARLTGKLRWMFWIGLGASAVLMAVACRGDLAIDEVISLQKAEGVKTWIEIVTQNQNDNNHLLNTFFLRLFGSQQNLFIYRIPAVLFGIATVAALGLAARRWGKEESVWVVYLAGLSSPVILYCSEARGYAPAMFFAVVSFELLQRCRERRTPVKLLLFWTTLCLGFLAHFSFAIICAGLGGWSLFHERAAGISRRGLLVNLARYFALPAVFMSCIYLVYIRHVIILGGMICSRREVIGAGASAALGLPDVAGLRWAAVLIAVALAGWGILALFRERRDEWVFMVLVLLVLPAPVFLAHPRFLYYRYFMVCFPFFYLLLAVVLARWFRGAGPIMKITPVLLTVAMMAGHMVKTANLLHYGRGNYRRAILDMAAAMPGPVIRAGGDNDFRNRTMLGFYSRYLPASKRIEYIPAQDRNRERPEWMVVCCMDTSFPVYPDLEVGTIGKYNLFGVYPYAGLSGWSWFVYRLPPDAGPPK